MLNDRRARLRAQPTPHAPEPAIAIVTVAVLAMALAPLVAQAAASLLTTGTPTWPRPDHLLEAAFASWRGDWGVGLRGQTSPTDRGTSEAVLWSMTAIVLTIDLAIGVVIVSALGGGAGARGRHGLASRTEASAALGARALRRRARVLRPDLHRPAWLRVYRFMGAVAHRVLSARRELAPPQDPTSRGGRP